MKKSVLLLAAAMVAGNAFALTSLHKGKAISANMELGPKAEKVVANASTRADEGNELEWGYAGDPYTAYRLGSETKSTAIYMAFKIPASDCTLLAGNKIKAITVNPGCNSSNKNSLKKVFPFITTDLTAEEYEYSGTLQCSTTAFDDNTLELEEPYTIEAGKDLYVGYYFAYTTSLSSQYYITVDGDVTDADNMLYGVAESVMGRPTSFTNYASQIGSLCASVTLTGDNLPENIVGIADLLMSPYAKPGVDFIYDVTIWNRGSNAVNNVTFETTINGETTSYDVTLSSPLASGQKQDVEVSAKCSAEGIFDTTTTVAKVNGNENSSPLKSSTSSIGVYTNGYDRKIVCEEGTGTWCGYCPAGSVMMEYMKENYGENFALIGAHNGDEMAISLYQNMISDYISGFPCTVFNRYYTYTPSGYTEEEQHEIIKALKEYYTSYPSYAKVELEGTVNQDKKRVELTANTTFAFDSDTQHYLSFVVVEDNVGPYVQTNYYANNSLGTMGGWESKGSKVSTYYNDVARVLVGYPGISNSIPSHIDANVTNSYSANVSLSNVTGNDFRVIAMIINGVTGEIINATEVPFVWDSAVENISAEENIDLTNGVVYTLDGRKVANENLAKGLYIVVNNGKAAKVLVK